jgi:hypothetical protein
LFACFNRSIAEEIKGKLEAHEIDSATALTIHQVGLRLFLPRSTLWKEKTKEELPRSEKQGSQYGKKSYLVYKHMPDVNAKDKYILYRLASLAQANLTDPKDPEAVGALFDRHLTQYAEDLEKQERLMKQLPTLLELCKADTYHVDFDDMIWLPNVLDLKTNET